MSSVIGVIDGLQRPVSVLDCSRVVVGRTVLEIARNVELAGLRLPFLFR